MNKEVFSVSKTNAMARKSFFDVYLYFIERIDKYNLMNILKLIHVTQYFSH